MLDKENLQFVKSRFTFWDKLNDTEKDLIKQNTTKITYKKGQNLHSADNECLGTLIIQNGELRIYILSEDGREGTLFRLSSGDTCVLSASCVLYSINFDIHIDAETDTDVFLLNIGSFSKLSEHNVYVENYAYKSAVERFSDIMWAIEQILFLSFDKRLAIFLLDEMVKTSSSEIKLTQEQVAKYIGSAREVVSRMLKVFQTQGILEQSRGLIRILDKEKLKELI